MVALIPLLPVLGFVILIFFGFKLKEKAPIISASALGISFILSVITATKVISGTVVEISYPWLPIAAFNLRADLITAWMLLLVSGVGFLIQIYSIGYMKGDPRFSRFFAYLSLFCAAMLGLVLSNNILLMYICWELVGLCSYFLIGFWFEKPSAAAAAKKAFIFTRAGDIGFFMGLLLIYFKVGSLDFATIFAKAPSLTPHILTACTLLLFCGAIGKSAQFPLHVWLPDAMEGPTPVSALIHAATMVTAGVYMVARMFPLFLLAPYTLTIIGYLGVFTALMAGLIAVTQTDIKKVLAYSTISQLGFMMLGLGSRSYEAGVFHLLSHGFFKALLFLGAGSIIHAVHSNEMADMGGILKAMPITAITFILGTLALAGIPPLSGFFSKDEILVAAYHNLPIAFYLAIIAVFLTAFYMFRLCFKVFPGDVKGHPHESPYVMTIPLIILSVMAVGYGFFNPFAHGEAEPMNFVVLGLSLGAALFGILCAWVVYGLKAVNLDWVKNTFVYKFIAAKFYMDEFYIYVIGVPVTFISNMLSIFDGKFIDAIVNFAGVFALWISQVNKLFDVYIVDGLVNLSGITMAFFGNLFKKVQTGLVQNYLLFVVLGIVVLYIFRR